MSTGPAVAATAEVAVLLVAGLGSRLRPLTDDRPKALMDVGGETILGRAVRLLVAHGVRRIVCATGYREDAVREALAACPVPVAYCANPAYDRTQNSVSLLYCRDAVGDASFFKLDGDVVFHPDVLTRLDAADGSLVVAVEKRETLGEEEMKVLVDGSRIHAFGKGLHPVESYGESIGIELVRKPAVVPLFHALSREAHGGRTNLYYEDVYSQLIQRGLDARKVDVGDLPWTEIDTPEDLARARELVASGALGG